MFQAQRIVTDKCRPVVLHGYGGAKKEMPSSLAADFGVCLLHAPHCGLAATGDQLLARQ